MNAPPPDNTAPERPGGAAPLAMPIGIVTLLVWGTLMLVFGRWLLEAHGTTLDWPSNLVAAYFVGALLPALLSRHGCRRRGWATALTAFLAASVVAVVLSTNVVAAAVILWAIDPAAAGGVGGLLASALAGLLLTVPVSFGAIVLLHRWQASDLPWKEWFKNENFRPTPGYGIVAGAAGFVLAILLAAWLDDWLAGAYPAASAVPTMGIQVPALAILGLLVLASPRDRSSALQAVAAAAILLETAFAGSIVGGLVAVTLQSNGFWLIIFDLVPLLPVLAGAVLLVARKPEGRRSSEQDAGSEEDAPA